MNSMFLPMVNVLTWHKRVPRGRCHSGHCLPRLPCTDRMLQRGMVLQWLLLCLCLVPLLYWLESLQPAAGWWYQGGWFVCCFLSLSSSIAVLYCFSFCYFLVFLESRPGFQLFPSGPWMYVVVNFLCCLLASFFFCGSGHQSTRYLEGYETGWEVYRLELLPGIHSW